MLKLPEKQHPVKKGTEQAQGENTKGQSWTDRKGTSYEMGSAVGKHAQQNPARAGIHFIWKGPNYELRAEQ